MPNSTACAGRLPAARDVDDHLPTRRRVGTWLLGALAATAALTPALANDGLALANRVYSRPAGTNLTTLASMQLLEAGRPPREREVVTYRWQKAGDERLVLIRFLQPADIAGVGLLSISEARGDTEQSLYLPDLDRSRKIASSRKGGRFVGSDLYFEDLQDRNPEDDAHVVVGSERIDGVACTVLDSAPKDPDSSVYARRRSWIDPETLLPLRVDYFERADGPPTKRWTVAARQKIQGYWTIMDSTMADLKQQSQTRLVVRKAIYDRKLPSKLFTSRALADVGYESEFRP